jgi:2-polyprenyl-6-methoxyphenol hydroxylase-like FAD-dependent oxidoreductase
MAQVLILGAGLNGLCTALLLARDGHQVTVVERDPAEPPAAADAWDHWDRAGVNQFRLLHFMLARWRTQMSEELPDVLDDLVAAGGLRMNMMTVLPEERRGPLRPEDDRFVTVTARRPVLEAVIADVVRRTPGIDVRRGVSVTGLLTRSAAVPRVTGVLLEGGGVERADLVVDCGGRRSQMSSWLVAAGARRPYEEREDSGFVYYGRHFRARDGRTPQPCANLLQHYDSVSVLTLPGDDDAWGVGFVISSQDRALRALRDPECWDAALAQYPLAAHWRDGELLGGVDAMAGIEDRFRRFVLDGTPVATGVLAVGDSWACTNPSLGRGASIGLLHARCLRDLLREVDVTEDDKLVRRFAELTESVVEPLYRMTVWLDRNRLAEIDADIAGTPYRPEEPRWTANKATFAASLVDPEIARAYMSLVALLTTPPELFAQPGMLDRIMQLGAGAPQYPLPGPTRQTLLARL